MKKITVSILFMAFMASFRLGAQKPVSGLSVGLKVPMYCGSTGSGAADSTRLPIMFFARIQGLTPGASYKYYARFISIKDTSSTTTTGVGTPIVLRKNGTWMSIPNPDLNTPGGHDTAVLSIGFSEITAWFGAIYNNDSRFAPGKYIYPMIVLEEIGSGSPVTIKTYIEDSINVLGFSNTFGANKGTAIYGSSFVKPKSMVLLYDIATGTTNRPVTISYAESEGLSSSNMQNWYNTKVNGVSGAWGSVVPNDLSSGITRIESRDPGFDTIIYANIETDGTWGPDSTINQKGGAIKPIVIKSDYAPLVKPEFEFVTNTTNLVESNTVVKMLVRRRYGNHDSSKVSAFVVAGTATNNVDYKILSTFPMSFRPYGDVIDTIRVQVMDDFSSEPTENAAIRLNNPVNAKIGFQTTHSIVITDNDIPVVNFAKKTATTKEGAGILKVRLKINSGSTTPTNVRVVVKSKTDSTFIPSEFKIGSSNKDTIVQFAGGKVIDSFEFNIPIIDDIFSEDRSDTVILAIRNPTAPATIGPDSLFTLIIEDNDAPSLFKFNKKTMSVKENVGSVNIRINRILGNTSQSDIILTYDADSKNAQPGTDYTFSPQLLSFDNTDPDSLIFNIPILNDNFSEPKEDAVFIIRSSFNARIGKPDTIRVSIIDDDLVEYSISKVTSTKSPNFTVDSLNVHCALRGVVYGVNMGPVGNPQGLSFTLVDNTGGIQIFKPSGGTKGYTVTEGDSIQVYGRIAQVNGMIQMNQLDTILKFGSGRPLKTPVVVNFLSETSESRLIKYNLVKLADPSQWPSSAMAANTSKTLKVLTVNDSFNLIIDAETDIDGKPVPSGFFNVIGIGSQNDPTSPFSSNYFMSPRRYSDFINLVVPVFGFTTPTSGAVEKHDSTDGFTLQCANLTSNQQITLAIKGGTAGRNVDYQSNATRLFILTPSQPSFFVKSKLNDDAIIDPDKTIIWVIKDNSWGTLIGPDSIHTVTIIDDESTGIDAIGLASKLKVYPNPATKEVSITSEEAIISRVEVYDVNGRVVRTFENLDKMSVQLNIEGLTKGLYHLSVTTDKGLAIKTLSIL